jgi:amidase
MDELRSWDAVETAERLRRREVSPREVVAAAIARAERASHLGAVVTATPERALAEAEQPRSGPFAGVPTFVKDLSQLEGVRTTWGSRGAGEFVSKRTDASVRRLLELGFVSLGKSATPEFGLTATTEPLGRPPCRNPWNPERSSGGSSGGAAALVAAGVVPVAHASDGGGSIRIPASCCGLVGLKPSRFRFDMEGSNLLPVNVATDGLVTRTVRDAVAFWTALDQGPRPRGLPPVGPVAPEPKRGLRVAVFTSPPRGTPVHPEHRDAALDAGRVLQSLGHAVEEVPCPIPAREMDDFLLYWGLVAWMQLSSAKFVMHRGFDLAQVEPFSLGMARTFTSQRLAALAATRRLRGFTRRYTQALQGWDLLLCPTTASPAPPLGKLSSEAPFESAYAGLCDFAAFTPIQNAAGAPGLSLPWGRSAAGVPIGVQLAAAPGRDGLLLEVAQVLEAARPWQRLAPAA